MKTVLIAEDEFDIRVLLRLALEDHFIILEALDGEEALEIAQDYQPDLILLNVLMPKVDGIEVAKRLKEIELTKDIPIIFISSLSSPTDIQRGLATGAIDYIVKPFCIFELRAKLLKMLKENNDGKERERSHV